jgi:lysophospholipase L1-like esterase
MVSSTTALKPDVRTPLPEPVKRPSKWRKVFAIVACQLVAVLFVEAMLYCAGLGEEEIFKFDPVVGFHHMHNKRITWRTEGFSQFNLNADGMREPGLTVAKPANTYRVAFLGDSMVEGYQVPIEQTFGELVSKDLGDLNGKKLQALNFGTSGYSTAQEYLQLKRQVMQYKPDLVVLCYNSRDMFENWTAPDQVITNVRPAALHLPGGGLCVDSAQVQRWFNSPRAKFLRSVDWLRQNSRIYGLFAAIDLEWSQKNPWYRAFIDTLAKPKRGFEQFAKLIATEQNKGPSWQINFFEDTKKAPAPVKPVAAKAPQAADHVFISAASNDSLSQSPELTATKSVMPETSYTKVITHTLGSLITEMRAESVKGGAKFAVMALPVRAQLSPLIGMETAFGTIDYPQELDAVEKICSANNIPYVDVEAAAETSLPLQKRDSLFYVVHLSPEGHQFIARQIAPLVKEQLTAQQN